MYTVRLPSSFTYIVLRHLFQFGGQIIRVSQQRSAFLNAARQQQRLQLFVRFLQVYVWEGGGKERNEIRDNNY